MSVGLNRGQRIRLGFRELDPVVAQGRIHVQGRGEVEGELDAQAVERRCDAVWLLVTVTPAAPPSSTVPTSLVRNSGEVASTPGHARLAGA